MAMAARSPILVPGAGEPTSSHDERPQRAHCDYDSCVIWTFQIAQSMDFKGQFRQ